MPQAKFPPRGPCGIAPAGARHQNESIERAPPHVGPAHTTALAPTAPHPDRPRATDDRLWARLAAHPLDDARDGHPLSARLQHSTGWSAAHTERVLLEYRRFLYLAVRRRGRVCPSGAVDEAWHTHLLDTPRYFGEFCPRVLGTVLHHVPERGQRTTDHPRRYRATLRAYRWAFGEAPPRDIWPAPADRFAERRQHVDLAGHWLLPHPATLWRRARAAGCAMGHRLAGQRRPSARLARPWAAALVLPLVLTLGCAQGRLSIQPQLNGPDFLTLYFWALVLMLAVGIWRAVHGQASTAPRVDADRLDPIEYAYLAGGALRAVAASLARLWQRDAIAYAPEPDAQPAARPRTLPWRPARPPDAGAPPLGASALEGAVLAEIRQRGAPEALLPALQVPLDQLHARLHARGLLSTPSRSQRQPSATDRLYSAAWTLVLAWGALRVVHGWQRGYAVSLLVVLIGIGAVLALVMHKQLPHRRTREGHAAVRQARRQLQQRRSLTMGSPHLALGVALLGTGVLGAGMHPLHDSMALLNPHTSGGSGCGGTGCGGSGGGGGDGGCGGGGD